MIVTIAAVVCRRSAVVKLKDPDWSVVMEKISRAMLEDTRKVFSTGLGEWPSMAGNASTTLADWNQRAWSPENAVVVNRAPHAHLIEAGTKQYLFVDESSFSTFRGHILDHISSAAEDRELGGRPQKSGRRRARNRRRAIRIGATS
jgi:hypothetical protein